MQTDSSLPSQFRGEATLPQQLPTSWLRRRVSRTLKRTAFLASSRPIYTVALFATIASFSYLGLLQETFVDVLKQSNSDWFSVTQDARTLYAGPESRWQWQALKSNDSSSIWSSNDHRLTLFTLAFPQDIPCDPDWSFLTAHQLEQNDDLDVNESPLLYQASEREFGDRKYFAFSLPHSRASKFWKAAQKLSCNSTISNIQRHHVHDNATMVESYVSFINTSTQPLRIPLFKWAENSWRDFVVLFRHSSSMDTGLMTLMYSSTMFYFVSLFQALRRTGSSSWVFIGAILSTVFSFLFAISLTAEIGTPITLTHLSEGIPFLIVFVGFGKYTALTDAALSYSRSKSVTQSERSGATALRTSQSVLLAVVVRDGFAILQQYAIQVGLTTFVALCGTQSGLRQFCLFATLVQIFDCVLLFTFFIAILCIKLEINQIKQRQDFQQSLLDDGIDPAIAKDLAQNKTRTGSPVKEASQTSIFGQRKPGTQVARFKFFMITGFILVNSFNLYNAPFKSASPWAQEVRNMEAARVKLHDVTEHKLHGVLAAAQTSRNPTAVTILPPMEYELHYDDRPTNCIGKIDTRNPYVFEMPVTREVRKRMLGVLNVLDDPSLSKWILFALVVSITFNSYLLDAKTSGSVDQETPKEKIDLEGLRKAMQFNSAEESAIDNDSKTLSASVVKHASPSKGASDKVYTNEITVKPKLGKRSQPLRQPATSETSTAQAKSQGQVHDIIQLKDEEIVALGLKGSIPGHALEKLLKDHMRAIKIRRNIVERTEACTESIGLFERGSLPYEQYDWSRVHGTCCENVIGYMPMPVGIAGPLVVDGKSYFIPMATTEGVLVASTNRGCKAINSGGGAVTVLTADGMTRGPCCKFKTLERAAAAKSWLDSKEGMSIVKSAFDSTSRFARLENLKVTLAGSLVFIRFKTKTGDAMGMNMISKGVEHALNVMMSEGFEDMDVVSLSGNYCVDKKPSAMNWIDGRGKSVTAEALIPSQVLQSVLKCDAKTLIEMNQSKNLIGSAMAGSIGGFNAQAANIVAAIFIATGQDPAQVVESSSCITLMNEVDGALQISVSMPSLEVGTLGGGTILEPQATMLDMLGVRGPHAKTPGENARSLARIIAAATLAGELSLCSALAAGHLVRAHMAHNRASTT